MQRHDPALAGEGGRDEPQHRVRDLVALEVDRGNPELVAQEADEIVGLQVPEADQVVAEPPAGALLLGQRLSS